MVVECGMDWDNPLACKKFPADLIAKVKSVSDHQQTRVFYWEPECNVGCNGYTLAAFDNSGKPTVAWDVFK